MFDRIKAFGSKLRYLGQKVASGAAWFGQKAGGALMAASPVLSAINPSLGAGAASLGGVLTGVGAIGSIASNALNTGRVDAQDVSRVRGALSGIRDDAQAIRDAYRSGRPQGSRLERRR